jgi:hypothetical protein
LKERSASATISASRRSRGETILDLGCGAGIDTVLAARRTGPSGRVIALDFLPEMLERTSAAAAEAGLANESVDHVISNGVVNLSARKRRVLAVRTRARSRRQGLALRSDSRRRRAPARDPPSSRNLGRLSRGRPDGATLIAFAFWDVGVELLLVVGFVLVLVVVIRGLRSRATRWQVVPLGCAAAALALALAPIYGLTQFLAVVTLVPTAVAWRKVRGRRLPVLYLGSSLNVIVVVGGLALLFAPPS